MNKLIFLLTFLICVSCGRSTDNRIRTNPAIVQSTIVGQENPIINALSFINSYVDNCNKMKESIELVQWVNSNKLTTTNFRTELKRVMSQAKKVEPEIGLDADPIFDAQDYPDKGFELDSFDSKTNYIVIKGKNWPDFKLTIKMVLENDDWLVDGCGIINIPNDKRIAR